MSAIHQEAGKEHLLSAWTEKAELLALYLQLLGVKYAFMPLEIQVSTSGCEILLGMNLDDTPWIHSMNKKTHETKLLVTSQSTSIFQS